MRLVEPLISCEILSPCRTAGCGRALIRQLQTAAREPIKLREAAHEYSLPKM
jgi:hypothetical protein